MRNKVFLNTDRTHAWATTTVRNAERFVQVQVANIAAQITRTRQTNHRVHIRAVDINLPTKIMNDLAHVNHSFLKHTVG